MTSTNINDYEFKIFSQFGDDGIIQYLIKHIPIENKMFIEFGVANYLESNTRFLMMKDNWSGFVMDGTEKINQLKDQSWYWKYNLTFKKAFITKSNINSLLSGFSNIGVLSIDLDGNDYYILDELNFSKLNPSILILEYNSVFGKDRFITIPYERNFFRGIAHYSKLYFGASLPALKRVASEKGYAFIGCNKAGNNAYFIRNDLLNDRIKPLSIKAGFVESKFRESRDKNGMLSFITGKQRYQAIKGMPVLNCVTNRMENL